MKTPSPCLGKQLPVDRVCVGCLPSNGLSSDGRDVPGGGDPWLRTPGGVLRRGPVVEDPSRPTPKPPLPRCLPGLTVCMASTTAALVAAASRSPVVIAPRAGVGAPPLAPAGCLGRRRAHWWAARTRAHPSRRVHPHHVPPALPLVLPSYPPAAPRRPPTGPTTPRQTVRRRVHAARPRWRTSRRRGAGHHHADPPNRGEASGGHRHGMRRDRERAPLRAAGTHANPRPRRSQG